MGIPGPQTDAAIGNGVELEVEYPLVVEEARSPLAANADFGDVPLAGRNGGLRLMLRTSGVSAIGPKLDRVCGVAITAQTEKTALFLFRIEVKAQADLVVTADPEKLNFEIVISPAHVAERDDDVLLDRSL